MHQPQPLALHPPKPGRCHALAALGGGRCTSAARHRRRGAARQPGNLCSAPTPDCCAPHPDAAVWCRHPATEAAVPAARTPAGGAAASRAASTQLAGTAAAGHKAAAAHVSRRTCPAASGRQAGRQTCLLVWWRGASARRRQRGPAAAPGAACTSDRAARPIAAALGSH